MEFYIIRHGQTNWNLEGKIQGQTNSSLTQKGIDQARLTAEKLKNISFSAMYSSDLERALKTAEIIASRHNRLQMKEDVRLRERKFGYLEGIGHEEFKTNHPDIYEKFRSNDPEYRIPEGESKNDLALRATGFFNDLVKNHAKDETILVVTHGGIINMFVRYILGIPYGSPRKFSLRNAAVNIVQYNDNDWRLITLGDISHLSITEEKFNKSEIG